MKRLVLLLLGVLGLLVVPALPASAHPLGNFTVNRYDGVLVSQDRISVDHVVDLAEIPTVQARGVIDADADGRFSATELASWARVRCADEQARLSLRLRTRSVPLAVTAASARTVQGQAGLPTLRIVCALRSTTGVAGAAAQVIFADQGKQQVGWREITVRGDAVAIGATRATNATEATEATDTTTAARPRATSPSKRLTSYPKDLLTSPLDERRVAFTATPGGPRLGAGAGVGGGTGAEDVLARPTDRLGAAFTSLVGQRSLGLGAALLAVGLALLIGAMHAVAPGHGKTIMAFYLVGRGESRQRAARSALTVGVTVTLTHTVGVLVLGLLIASAASVTPAAAYPWLGAASGLVVAVVGAGLLRQALRRRRDGERGHAHFHAPGGPAHPHPGHGHPHPHPHPHPHLAHGAPGVASALAAEATLSVATLVAPHAHPHEHSPHEHAPDLQVAATGTSIDGAGPDRRGRTGLVAVGIAGGLVPSPSALVVLLGAAAVGRAWFGVVLVVAFGLGMAATLSVTGLLLVATQDRVSRLSRPAWLGPAGRRDLSRVVNVVPVVSACAVCLLGLYLVVRALLALP